MKSRTWIILLAALAVLSGILGFLLLRPGENARTAQIYSGGQLYKTVDLLTDQEFTVTAPNGGENTVTVADGKIAVTSATCPDHYCMRRGFCSSGAPIICLPNQLEIHFLTESEADLSIG